MGKSGWGDAIPVTLGSVRSGMGTAERRNREQVAGVETWARARRLPACQASCQGASAAESSLNGVGSQKTRVRPGLDLSRQGHGEPRGHRGWRRGPMRPECSAPEPICQCSSGSSRSSTRRVTGCWRWRCHAAMPRWLRHNRKSGWHTVTLGGRKPGWHGRGQ